MKHKFLFFSLVLFTITSSAQKSAYTLTSKLIHGCPKEIEFIKNTTNQSDFTYWNLETGIDSMAVMFVETVKDGRKTYWITLSNKDKLLYDKNPELQATDDVSFSSNTIVLKFDNLTKTISVQITHNTVTDEIQYVWVNKNQFSKKAIIVVSDSPIIKGKKFPLIKVETLNGDSISTADFIGKYVVINWWATTCAPCRVEIPGLNTLVEKYKNNSDIVFLAIAGDEKSDLKNYLNSKEFKYIQALTNKKVSAMFGNSLPKNIIINPRGTITYYSVGGHENKYLTIDNELKRQMDKK